jgi:ketosteroid isomerase-like protein
MKRILSLTFLVLALPIGIHAQTAPAADELTTLLKEFLAGASRHDAAIHDRFWADDLIYTGSGGKRRGKEEVLRDVRSTPAPKPGDATTVYTAEEIRIQQYGDSAVIAFRLVATTQKDGKSEVTNYLNSGTFIKRNGKWQVVNWQSTKVPPIPERP